jgi:hypothetical protein
MNGRPSKVLKTGEVLAIGTISFLIMGEVLNHMVRQALTNKEVNGSCPLIPNNKSTRSTRMMHPLYRRGGTRSYKSI